MLVTTPCLSVLFSNLESYSYSSSNIVSSPVSVSYIDALLQRLTAQKFLS